MAVPYQQMPANGMQQQQQMQHQQQMGGNQQLGMMITQPSMGGVQQQSPGMPTFPMIWPQGVGVTDRDYEDPEDCTCPPCCYCITKPIWFRSSDLRTKSKEEGWRQNLCMPGWEIKDADVLGQKMTFVGKETCGVETCYEPEVHVFDGERAVGKVIMKMPCCAMCSCDEIDLALAKDANGKEKFARMEHPCCGRMRYLRKVDNSCCGWWEYQWPVRAKYLPPNAPPVAQIIYRFHYNFVCHPIWVGFRQIPGSLGPDDQKLLLGMAIVRLWRAENEQKKENENGTNDGNPVY